MSENDRFGQWCILELLNSVRLAGFVTEITLFGREMGKVDVPVKDGTVTQYFSGDSVLRIIPTSKETAVIAAQAMNVEPPEVYILNVAELNLKRDPNIYADLTY